MTSNQRLTSDPLLQRFCDIYTVLDANNLQLLAELYSDQVQFHDPFRQVTGLAALQTYFGELYSNLTECRFAFQQIQQTTNGAVLTWTLTYAHRRIARGRPIEVEGCSNLTWQTTAGGHSKKIWRHRDYFDAGQMLYEHLPIVGSIIRSLKARL